MTQESIRAALHRQTRCRVVSTPPSTLTWSFNRNCTWRHDDDTGWIITSPSASSTGSRRTRRERIFACFQTLRQMCVSLQANPQDVRDKVAWLGFGQRARRLQCAEPS